MEKGSNEVSASMMQVCYCRWFSVNLLRMNEVQNFDQVSRKGNFTQALLFPVSEIVDTDYSCELFSKS